MVRATKIEPVFRIPVTLKFTYLGTYPAGGATLVSSFPEPGKFILHVCHPRYGAFLVCVFAVVIAFALAFGTAFAAVVAVIMVALAAAVVAGLAAAVALTVAAVVGLAIGCVVVAGASIRHDVLQVRSKFIADVLCRLLPADP